VSIRGEIRARLALAALALLLTTACVDNATRLYRRLGRAADELYAGPDFQETLVPYLPVAAPEKPYWLVFFPEGRTRATDLVRAGMPPAVADQIFRELGYVDVGLRRMLVVWQPGERLSFSGYSGRVLVRVEGLLVAERVGPSEIVVRKRSENLYITGVR
jgi:hypothetical protein